MDKKQFSENILRTLGVDNYAVNHVRCSYNGMLFDPNDEQLAEIKKLEAGGNLVYAIIHTSAVFGGTDECQLESYLLVTPEDESEDNVEIDLEDGCYEAFAYVKNLTWPDCSEYGYVGVREMYGGIVRIW